MAGPFLTGRWSKPSCLTSSERLQTTCCLCWALSAVARPGCFKRFYGAASWTPQCHGSAAVIRSCQMPV
eukprot:jgi/Astpho2/6777/Aster-07222